MLYRIYEVKKDSQSAVVFAPVGIRILHGVCCLLFVVKVPNTSEKLYIMTLKIRGITVYKPAYTEMFAQTFFIIVYCFVLQHDAVRTCCKFNFGILGSVRQKSDGSSNGFEIMYLSIGIGSSKPCVEVSIISCIAAVSSCIPSPYNVFFILCSILSCVRF